MFHGIEGMLKKRSWLYTADEPVFSILPIQGMVLQQLVDGRTYRVRLVLYVYVRPTDNGREM